MLIGMFHNRKNPNDFRRAYLYSAISKHEGAEFYYFTPKRVDFNENKILGLYYDNGTWKEKLFPFPDVIINTMNAKNKNQKNIENRLKELIPFTSFPVGSKIETYKLINKGKLFSENVIPFKLLNKFEEAIEFVNKYNKVVIKPIRGHHGEGLILVTKDQDKYYVKEAEKEYIFDEENFIAYIKYIQNTNKYLMQKFIDSRVKSGAPFDYRIHMQKNKKGQWQITIIVPRVGSPERVVTNISRGATMMEFEKFLKNEFPTKSNLIKAKIVNFALEFSKHFESLYSHKFDELGIDVGMDQDTNLWIYEVNWRPGHVFIEAITAKKTIEYALFLAKKTKEEKNGKNKVK